MLTFPVVVLAPTPVLAVSFAAIAVWELLLLKLQPPLVVPEELQVVAVRGQQRLHPNVIFFLLAVNLSKGRSHPLQVRELKPESLKVSGMSPWQCGPRVWCWLVFTVVWLVLVERQLDLSSVTFLHVTYRAFRFSVVCGMTGLVASEVLVATVIPVATAFAAWKTDLSGCRGAQGGRVLVAVWAAVAIRFVSRRLAPSRSEGRRLKALAGAPSPSFGFPPFLLLPEEEKFPLSFSGGLGLVESSASSWWSGEERGGGVLAVVKALRGVVVATLRCSIPAVRLPADVATTERVATLEEASPRSDATLSQPGWPVLVSVLSGGVPVSRAVPCVPALADGPSGGFRKGCHFSFAQCPTLEGLSARQVVTITWDPYPRAPVSEGVAPGGGRAQVSDLEQRGKRWGQRRVVFGLTRVVVEAFLCFRCFVVLCRRNSLSQEFVCRTVVVATCSPCVASSVSCERESCCTMVSFPARFECELQESVVAVAGCACFERGCWFARAAVGFVVGLRVRVGVSRRLRESACGVAFTGASCVFGLACLCTVGRCALLIVNSGKVLPEFFSVGSSGELFVVVLASVVWLVANALPSRLRCIAWLPCVLVRFSELLVVVLVRFALRTNDALVVLVEVLPEPVVLLPLSVVFSLLVVCLGGVLVMVPRTALGALGGGSSQSCLVCFAGCCSLGGDELSLSPVAFRFVYAFLGCVGGTPCVPVVGCFASSQLCAFFLCFLWLLGVVVLCHGLGAVLRTVATFVAKVPPLLSCFEVELVAPLVRFVSLWHDGLWAACPVFSVSCGDSSLLARVVSACGATVLHLAWFWCLWWHPVLVLEWFVFVPSGALVHCVALWVAPGACVSTMFYVVFPDRSPISGTPGVGPRLCSSFALSLGSEGARLGVVVVTTGKSRCDLVVLCTCCFSPT
ncbi:hypothetical protein Taro_048639, partial [Colocasia esculenta]|nr:hypothetical protein [Colocasia esculenta]